MQNPMNNSILLNTDISEDANRNWLTTGPKLIASSVDSSAGIGSLLIIPFEDLISIRKVESEEMPEGEYDLRIEYRTTEGTESCLIQEFVCTMPLDEWCENHGITLNLTDDVLS